MPSLRVWSVLVAGVVAVMAFQQRETTDETIASQRLDDDAEDKLRAIVDKFEEYYRHFEQLPATNPEPFTPLEELNAKSASLIYSRLKDAEIRLVKLHPGTGDEPLVCSLLKVKRSSAPSYTALSYVWGSQVNPKVLLLDGTPILITRNLESALLQLRSPDDTALLWIDALAINQTNIEERNQQVSIMRDIYSGAEETAVCLDPAGREGELISLVLEFLGLLSKEPHLADDLPLQSLPVWLYRCITSVGGLAYWERVWVAQEVMFSRDVTIVHQGRRMPYAAFTDGWDILARRLKAQARSAADEDSLRFLELSTFLTTFGPTILPGPGSALAGKEITLDAWMESIQHKKSTDARDIVFGYHGCFPAAVRAGIKIDYSAAPDQVWAAMTALIIEHTGKLNLILGHHNYERTLPGLPSWVPQWSADSKTPLSAATGFRYLPVPFAAGGALRAQCTFTNAGRVLHTAGVEIGTVDVVLQPGFKEQRVADRSEMFGWLRGIAPDDVDAYFHRLRRAFGIGAAAGPAVDELVDAFAAGNDRSEWQVAECLALRGHLIPDPRRGQTVMVHHFGRKMCSYRTPGGHGSRGKVGYVLGPGSLASGDTLCVLQGCSVPVALREVGAHHILLGDAYVPGCMMGKLMESIEHGSGRTRQFSIE